MRPSAPVWEADASQYGMRQLPRDMEEKGGCLLPRNMDGGGCLGCLSNEAAVASSRHGSDEAVASRYASEAGYFKPRIASRNIE